MITVPSDFAPIILAFQPLMLNRTWQHALYYWWARFWLRVSAPFAVCCASWADSRSRSFKTITGY